MGLAVLRPDGFGGLAGTGFASTVLLAVPINSLLTVSIDVMAKGGSVRIGAAGVAGLDAASAVPLTTNCTDAVVKFGPGRSFAELGGTSVVLEMQIESAMVFTVGFKSVELN